METPLFLPGEPKTQMGILKGVTGTKCGKIGVPDYILAKNLLIAADGLDDSTLEWRQHYDYHLIEFQVLIAPNHPYKPEWVEVLCTLNPRNPPLERSTAKHLFPSTQFVDPDWKISGEFGVSASLGFDEFPDFLKKFAQGSFKGEAKIQFNYSPKVARVYSGGVGGSNFYWHFQSASGEAPVGGLDLKAVVTRPRRTAHMELSFEVTAQFKKTGFHPMGDDPARASSECEIRFNASPH